MPSGSIGNRGVPTGTVARSTGICATVILEDNTAVGITSQQGREQCLQPLGQHGSPPGEPSLDCAGDGADGPASSGWTRAHPRSQARDPQDVVPSLGAAAKRAKTEEGRCIARNDTASDDARILVPKDLGPAVRFARLKVSPS